MKLLKKVLAGNISGKAFYTVLDQAALSGVNFTIGLAFVYFSSPENYGFYTLFMGVFFLFLSVQNALINTPMIVLSPKLENGEAVLLRRSLFAMLLLFLVVVFLSMMVITFFSGITGADGAAVWVLPLAVCLLLLREYFRTEEYAQLLPQKALKRDSVYAVAALVAIGTAVYTDIMYVSLMFLITGAASLLVSARKMYQFTVHLPPKRVIQQKFRDTWKLSQWSLFGATSSWLQGNAYLLLLFLMLGVTEVAYIAAARLLMTPIVLIITSWSNVMRPLLSKAMVRERPGRAETLMYQGMAASVVILLVYTLVLMAGLAVVPSGAFPEAYQGIQEYVLLWMLVFLFQLIRVNYSNYFQSALFFKMLAKSGMVVAVITVAMTAITVQAFGEAGALVGLMLSELLFSIILLLKMKVDVPVVEKREE